MKWFYSRDGQQIGPVEFSEIERLRAAGELTAESLVWQQGTAGWVKLGTILDPAGQPVVPPPAAPPASRISALAICSLVFGILGLCCLLFIPAIICGHIALVKMSSDPGLKGKGMAIAGLVLGYLVLLLNIYVYGFTDLPQQMQKWAEEIQRQQQAVPVTPGTP